MMLSKEGYILKARKKCLELGKDSTSIPEFIIVGKNILEQKCLEYQKYCRS